MDLHSRKIEFIQEFLKVQSEDVINRLEKIIQIETKTSDNENLKHMSIEEFNERIDISMDDAKSGRLIKVSDLKA